MTDQADLIYERLLVVRAQAGDGAFASLSSVFRPGCGISCESCRRRPTTRKMPCKTCGSMCSVLSTPVDPQALVAWLYRIARDRAFARLRKRSCPSNCATKGL